MSDTTFPAGASVSTGRPNLDHKAHSATLPVFLLLLACGLGYAVYGLLSDMNSVNEEPLAVAHSCCWASRC